MAQGNKNDGVEDIRCVICKSLMVLDGWLSSPEMAFLSINGGIERTIRDRLMYQMQRLLPDKVVRSEGGIAVEDESKPKGKTKKRADIAILEKLKENEQKTRKKEPLKPFALIEIKHNFLFQEKIITGKDQKNKAVDSDQLNEVENDNNDTGRIEEDIAKWSNVKFSMPLFFIQIVIVIEKIPDDRIHFLKYPSSKPTKREETKETEETEKNLKEIKKYFCDLEKREKGILKAHKTRAVSKYPYELDTSLHFYILEIRPEEDSVEKMRGDCDNCKLLTGIRCKENSST